MQAAQLRRAFHQRQWRLRFFQTPKDASSASCGSNMQAHNMRAPQCASRNGCDGTCPPRHLRTCQASRSGRNSSRKAAGDAFTA